MELRQLHYFQLVCRLGSVTKAAKYAHVAQPAISIAIKKMETELGLPIFERSQKQLILTTEGRIFLQRVECILKQFNETMMEMNDYKNLQKGAIQIGIPPMLGAFLFPYIFNRFQQQYSQLELDVVEEGSLAICNKLEQGAIDVGVITISSLPSCVTSVPITTGEVHVCLPPEHPLGNLSCISFVELREEPFILLKEDTYVHQLILNQCAKYNFSPHIIFSSSQIETILGLVEQGAGITFLLGAIAQRHSNIVSKPLKQALFLQAGLAWNQERYLSKAAQAFIDFIKMNF